MSNELQKIGYASTRTLCEAGNEEREPVFNAALYEIVEKYSSVQYHFPSQERLAVGGATPAIEAIDCGAEIIGVKDNSWSNITGDCSLWATLDSIDALFDAYATTGAILKDGSVDMEANWNMWYKLTVNNLDSVDADYTGHHLNILGSELISDVTSGSLSAEILANGAFTSAVTEWAVSDAAWAFTSDQARFTSSDGSSGYLYQTSGYYGTIEPGAWYLFQYDVKALSGTVSLSIAQQPTGLAQSSITLDTSVADEKQIIFKAYESYVDQNFALFASCGGVGYVYLDNVSLKKIEGGTLTVLGDIAHHGETVDLGKNQSGLSITLDALNGDFALKHGANNAIHVDVDPALLMEFGNATDYYNFSFLGGSGNTITFYPETMIAQDNEFEFRGTNVAHGMTTYAATSAYGKFGEVTANEGGMYIYGLSDSANIGLYVQAAKTEDTATPSIWISGGRPNGTAIQSMTASGYVASIRNYNKKMLDFYGGRIDFNAEYGDVDVNFYDDSGNVILFLDGSTASYANWKKDGIVEKYGVDGEISLTHVHNVGLTLNGSFGIGVSAPSTSMLYAYNNAITTTEAYYGIRGVFKKTAGVTDYTDPLYGVYASVNLDQVGGEIGGYSGVRIVHTLTNGTVGNVGSARDSYTFQGESNLDGGAVTGDAYGGKFMIDQAAGNTVTGASYVMHLQADFDGTTTGPTHMLYMNELTNVDYCIYQSGTAPSILGGNLTIKKDAGILYFGADSEVSLTHVHDTGLAMVGNLSIGKATFETWQSARSVLQVGGNSALMAQTAEGASAHLVILQNAYYNHSTTTYRTVTTDEASLHEQINGTHAFKVSNGVVTADNNITFITPLEIQNDGSIDWGAYRQGFDGSAGGLSFTSGHQATFSHAVSIAGLTTWTSDAGGIPSGSCYGNGIAWAQAAAVQNTWYNISDADMVDGSGGLLAVTHDGDGKLTVPAAGRYKIEYTLCFQADAVNVNIEAGIEVNDSGSAVGDGQAMAETKLANVEEHLSGFAKLDLAAGANVQVAIRTTDSSTPTITVHKLNFMATMVGGT